MEKFEAFKPQQKIEREKDKKGIFEKLYKSKTARALTFLGFLGVSGGVLPKPKYEYQPPTKKYELVEHRRFELKELSDKFKSEAQIRNKERSIVHIGQVHGGESIDQSQEMVDIKKLVSTQKNIEELMLFLAKDYKIKNFYTEGVLKEDLKFVDKIRNDISSLRENENKFPPETWNKLLNLATVINNKEIKSQMPDRHRAYVMYLTKCEFDKEISLLNGEYKNYKEGKEVASEKHKRMFELWEKKGVDSESVFKSLESHRNRVGKDELIRGDNIYIWGAPMKLYLEEKVNIKAAETAEANKQAFEKYPGGEILFTEEQLKDPEEKEKFQKILEERKKVFEDNLNIREDAAINIIINSPDFKSEQYIPLIYGEGHDFKDNIEQYNDKNPNQKIGLIKVISK